MVLKPETDMKKILYILSAALCLLTACEKELKFPEKLYGDWHCEATSTEADIYVTFTAENAFTLYQKTGQGGYKIYSGTYSLNAAESGYTLSGEYSDGTLWGTVYTVGSTDADTITLTAEGITETYTRVNGIPEEVLNRSDNPPYAY